MKVRRLPPVDDEVIPQSGRPLQGGLRQCALKVFPFVLVYQVYVDEIVIVAFANTHRRPGYWRDRVNAL